MTRQRLVTFAHSAVTVETEGARADRIVDFLFRDVPSDDRIAPHVMLRVAEPIRPEKLAVFRDYTSIFESESDAELAEYLLGDVTIALADKSQGGLVFHAGALVWHGHGVLVPGAIGAGKTTMTAWLVSRGLDYLTDEMVWVPTGTDVIHGFTRPLNVKKPSRAALRDVFDFEKHAGEILGSTGMDLIPPAVLKPNNVLSTPRIGLIVLPNYQPRSELEIQQLTKAQAGFALLETLVNARNLSEHGFREAARLARLAPAYRIRYSHFEQIREPLEDLLASVDIQRNP